MVSVVLLCQFNLRSLIGNFVVGGNSIVVVVVVIPLLLVRL